MEGKPGTGKSTMIGRMLACATATGVTQLVLGNLRPDYSRTVASLGGHYRRLGRRAVPGVSARPAAAAFGPDWWHGERGVRRATKRA